ncbi:MAG: hypothetical protein AVO33_07185 [delta proteobacterium ML8_F1]|nr:MAG: hypothetical protein AVO33_07185 [delta proteobacterium ML8_F1]
MSTHSKDRKIGLYLQGGGAKGAYQAGVLKVLRERGLSYDLVVGTSIGAYNSYFLVTDQVQTLVGEWLGFGDVASKTSVDGLFFNNRHLLDSIRSNQKEATQGKRWLVNYAPVRNSFMLHRYKDLMALPFEEQLKYLDYATRLPVFNETVKADLRRYEGLNIDGGMVDNEFVDPLKLAKLDEIHVIPLNNSFDESRLKAVEARVVYFYPPGVFNPGDGMRLEADLIKTWFDWGIQKAQAIMG